MTLLVTPIVSKSKLKNYTPLKVKKFELNSQLQTVQVLTNDA